MRKIKDNSYNNTVFLRFIAIILILNSHLDLYYPIKYIGTGGAIGNTLFFILSSYGLFKSFENTPQNFSPWYARRVARIYPAVWLTILFIKIPIIIANGAFHPENALVYLGYFYYPPFWFLQALMVYYLIFWAISSNYSDKKIFNLLIFSVVIYTFLYLSVIDSTVFFIENIPVKIFYYLIVFLLGILLTKAKLLYNGKIDILVASSSFIGMYGHKFLMTKNYLTEYQFIQQILCLVFCIFLFKICSSKFIKETVMNSSMASLIKYTSSITLEIYIVHVTISPSILSLHLSFPLNILIFLTSTFLLSSIIHILANKFLTVVSTNCQKNADGLT